MTGKTKQSTSNKRHPDSGTEGHEIDAQEVNQKPRQLLEQEIAHLETRLTDLESRLPAHSIPPSMLAEMDELEEQLLEARAKLASLRSPTSV